MANKWVVETDSLAVGYDGRLVLENISLKIRANVLTCIIGGSGSGKSTLLKACVGLVRPVRGTVSLLGQRLGPREPEEARDTLLARVGFMFQDGGLLNSLSVAENLAIPMRAHTKLPRSVIDDLVKMKLALVRLEGAGDKLPNELSGGMKKRAGLARALMLDPEVVFCDEPSAGLDPVTAAELDRVFLQLRDALGLTLVVVTHETASIKLIADRIVELDHGGVNFDGTLDAALASKAPTLRAFFGRVAGDEDDGEQAPTLDTLFNPEASPDDEPEAAAAPKDPPDERDEREARRARLGEMA
jgi:phospholipid/cholesterol/gamma-HCH transport system ATP-binding protein